MNGYTIGRLAQAAGVPVSTLRYYERAGLLQPEQRTSSNYRWYSFRSLQRVRFIRRAQQLGFTLKDVRRLLHLESGSPQARAQVRDILHRRLQTIEEQLRRLQQTQHVLQQALARCRRGRGCCAVLQMLQEEDSP